MNNKKLYLLIDEFIKTADELKDLANELTTSTESSLHKNVVTKSVCANKNHAFQIKWCGKCTECGQTDEIEQTVL